MTCKTRLLTVILLILLSYLLIPVNQSNAQSRFQHSDATAVMVSVGFAIVDESAIARSASFSASVNRKVDLSVGISTVKVKTGRDPEMKFDILNFGAAVYPSRQWDGSSVTSQFVLAVSNSYHKTAGGIGALTGFGLSKQIGQVLPGILFLYSPIAAGTPSDNFAIGFDAAISIGLAHTAMVLIGPSLTTGINYNSWVPGLAFGIVFM